MSNYHHSEDSKGQRLMYEQPKCDGSQIYCEPEETVAVVFRKPRAMQQMEPPGTKAMLSQNSPANGKGAVDQSASHTGNSCNNIINNNIINNNNNSNNSNNNNNNNNNNSNSNNNNDPYGKQTLAAGTVKARAKKLAQFLFNRNPPENRSIESSQDDEWALPDEYSEHGCAGQTDESHRPASRTPSDPSATEVSGTLSMTLCEEGSPALAYLTQGDSSVFQSFSCDNRLTTDSIDSSPPFQQRNQHYLRQQYLQQVVQQKQQRNQQQPQQPVQQPQHQPKQQSQSQQQKPAQQPPEQNPHHHKRQESDEKPQAHSSTHNQLEDPDEYASTVEIRRPWLMRGFPKRSEAVRYLHGQLDGSFVVRYRTGSDVERFPYALTFMHRGEPIHLQIERLPNAGLVLAPWKAGEQGFQTLDELVQHYRDNRVAFAYRNVHGIVSLQKRNFDYDA